MCRLRMGIVFVGIILFFSAISLEVAAENILVESISVAGDDNYSPYEFVDSEGNYRGFNVDIMNALSAQLGVDFILKPMPWDQAMKALDAKKVDVVQGMNMTKSREKKYSFSSPTVINTVAIFVQEGEYAIKDLKSLEGKTVAVQKGDIGMELLREQNVKFKEVEDQKVCMELLGKGEVDAYLGDRQAGLDYAQALGLEQAVKIVGTPMKMAGYGIAVRKEDEVLAQTLEEGLDAIKLNGTYDKIYEKWFGKRFTDESKVWRNLMILVTICLFCALCGILFISTWNRTLAREVRLRTTQLDASNRKRKAVLESTLDPIIVFDQQGEIVMANCAAKKLLGKEHLKGLHFPDLKLTKPLETQIAQSAEERQHYNTQLELEIEGEHKYFDCNVSPVTDAQNKVDGVILALHDHTELLLLKNALYQNDKLSALGRMAAEIAHELRNPLTAIKAYVDLLPKKLDNEQFRNKLIQVVPSEIHRMNEIINSLLDDVKPGTREADAVPIEPLLAQIIDLFAMKLSKNHIQITTQIQPQLLAFADPKQLKQVILNVILNSIEAIETDGEIQVTGWQEGERAMIKVHDNGCGIPEEELEHIFEPFCSSKVGGHGFGLLIVHNLMQENAGSIRYQSKEGIGTDAILSFPLAKESGKAYSKGKECSQKWKKYW